MRRIPIAPESWLILVPLLIVAAAALLIQWYAAALLFLTLAACVAQLFRDPHRRGAARPIDLLAPADGTVVELGDVEGGPGGLTQRIGIVSSIFDVHVLRAPVSGKVIPPDAGGDMIMIEAQGFVLAIVHQRGILSRKTLEGRVGKPIARGERIGMTQFGSRVDLFLPGNAKIAVQLHDRVKVGLSVVAEVETGRD